MPLTGARSRRRSDRIGAATVLFTQSSFQVNLAIIGKAGAALTGGRVQRNQACIQGTDQDALAAGLILLRRAVKPVGYAAVGDFTESLIGIKLSIESPAFLAVFSIDGKHAVESGRKIQCIACQHRGSLETVFVTGTVAFAGFAGTECPHRSQAFEIVPVDLAGH